MATCWQEVVAKDVKQCLARCDLSIHAAMPSCQATPTCKRAYVAVQQTPARHNGTVWWTLVVCGGNEEGFSRVIQSMDEVSGVRVRRREQMGWCGTKKELGREGGGGREVFFDFFHLITVVRGVV